MDWRDKWIDPLGAALVSSTLSLALTMMLCQALAVSSALGAVFFSCLLTGAICAVSVTSKKGAVAAAAIAAVLLVVLGTSKIGLFTSIGGLFSQIAALSSGQEASIAEYSATISVLIAIVLTAFMFWLADMDGGVYPAIALSIVLMMCAWLLSRSIDTNYAFLAAAALACMFARASDYKTEYVKAVPTAIIVALFAIMLLPSGNPTWAPLEQAAEKVRTMFNDYFFFTDPRTTYSISSDGFQPMGEMLGGPAQPDLGNIMIVETDDTLLLRGSIKRTYTTYSWTESAINSRYVFIDPLRKSTRNEVFDVDKLERLDISGAFKRVNPFVTIVSEGISTLFVPHRLVDLSIPVDIATYFSTSGEVFITRGVVPSDTYGIDAYIQTGDTSRMRALVNGASTSIDGEYESVKQAYTSLPAGIEDGVYSLAQTITQRAVTPYDKALAIESYLKKNYSYSLSVNYPPRNRDFVSFFLLKSKKGYCSYFASAMAVMARMAGLPSRYVEGYMVPARANGTTLVTGKNAHAWVEIYFNGIGWLSFNPTPGSGDSYTSPDSSGGNQDLGDDQEDAQDDGDDPSDAQPTPTPEPEGDEEQSDSSDQSDGENQSQDDEQADGDSSEDPDSEASDEPDYTSDDAEVPPDGGENGGTPNLWWLLLLIPVIAAALFLAKRLKDSDPQMITHDMEKTSDKLLTWYRAILLALEYQGQTPNPGETPSQFAARLVQTKLADTSFTAVSNQVSLNRYAARRPDATVLKQARQSYRQSVNQLKPIERVRWYCHRVVKGIGDIANIP